MRAADALAELRQLGLVLEPMGDRLLVTPRDRITDLARALIIENRDELLDLLRQPEPCCLELAERATDLADAWHERVAICLEAGDISETEARRIAEAEIGRRFVETFMRREVAP